MSFLWRHLRLGCAALCTVAFLPAEAQSPRAISAPTPTPAPTVSPSGTPRWTRRNEAMVEVTKYCRGIFVELRYATERNFTGKRIYPANARCFLRKGVADRLQKAQDELRRQGLGLKVWDAYRPAWAHDHLWKSVPDPEFVASPEQGGSWHTWGAAVDVTLVDLQGREQIMATDFDDFTPSAKSEYTGGNLQIAANMRALRQAMLRAGFRGLRDEWWHFTDPDAIQFAPVKMPLD